MKGLGTALIIVALIIGVIVLFFWLKPYIIRHDTTILYTGGLGSGKTLESVKSAIVLIRKNRFIKYTLYNRWHKFLNFFKLKHNKSVEKRPTTKKGKPRKIWKIVPMRKKPMLYSNIPIQFKSHWYTSKKDREWAVILEEKHITLLKEITEYSVVLIDEFPQFVNQFMWDEQIVQDNLNEFITFFRHYIGGYFICNAQSEAEIEVHFRRKLNQAIYSYDFHKWCFGLFYTNRMLDIMLSENISTMSTAQAVENTKIHFGLFPPRNTYDTRCYSIRYKNVLEKAYPRDKFDQLKTQRILRLKEYESPLDIETTKKQKQTQLAKVEKLHRKKDVKDEETN